MANRCCPSCHEKLNFLSIIRIVPIKPYITCKFGGMKITRVNEKSMSLSGVVAVAALLLLKPYFGPWLPLTFLIIFYLIYDYYKVRLRIYTEDEYTRGSAHFNLPSWLYPVLGFTCLVSGILITSVGVLLIFMSDKVMDIEMAVFPILILCIGVFSIYFGRKLFGKHSSD